jgi:hypothetical protein
LISQLLLVRDYLDANPGSDRVTIQRAVKIPLWKKLVAYASAEKALIQRLNRVGQYVYFKTDTWTPPERDPHEQGSGASPR